LIALKILNIVLYNNYLSYYFKKYFNFI